MPEVHFTNLLIVVLAAFVAPLVLGFFPRVRLPAIVLEIVLGIVIGPSGLGWVHVDLPITILSLVGLAFLLFLAGLEIDVDRLRGRVLRVTALGFGVSFVIGIVLSSTSLGVIVPVLKDSGNIASNFGQLVIAAASIADFGAIILLSLFFSGKGSTDTTGKLILLGLFAVLVVLTGLAIAGFERWRGLSRVLVRLQDTTAQIRVRGAFVLLIGFVALAENVGLETILGAFAAGAVLSLIDRDERMTHPQFRLKLEAAGFGIFIPVFFVTSGLRFDLGALTSSASTVAKVPLFLACLVLVRGVPALLLYVLWRYYADHAGVAELTPLPMAEWNWGTLPTTLRSIGKIITEKPVYFGCVAVAVLSLPPLLRRQGWTPTTRLLAFHAAAVVLYNLYLMAAYIAHFPGEMSSEAHSYFRYNTHLALVLVLSLALVLRDLVTDRGLVPRWQGLAGAAVIAAALLVPIAVSR